MDVNCVLLNSSASDMVSDFELMLAKKKMEQGNKRRKKKDIDVINDNDDIIADLIQKMKVAAEVDYPNVLLLK